QQTEVDSGDLLVIDIVLGNEDFPVLDLNGFAYHLDINPGLVDSASLAAVFYRDSWLGSGASGLSLSVSPKDGVLDAAFTRTSGRFGTGSGVIGSLSFIIEDEIEGLKIGDSDKFNFNINLNDALIQGADGRMVRLPNASTKITLNLNKEKDNPVTDKNLVVFPNPSHDMATIHLNGGGELGVVQVFNSQGSVVLSENATNNHLVINTSLLPTGMYIIQAQTDAGIITKKLIVE
ncbi:MAG: T9SS type A sorting domain-containing protein, partial [Saprospiraceae bacterium]|nr:T9SS type A sorting domain-containing protein [Saprospiraceae bacterium]